jgi:hypothetical protein
VNTFDVRIYTIRRRKGRRRVFGVRLAGSRPVEVISHPRPGRQLPRGAGPRRRQGLEFAQATGEPVLWAVPAPPVTTWLEHAVAYADMKWSHLAPHSRASLADALATVTPALTGPGAGRPPARTLRAALYGHVFNPQRRGRLTRLEQERLGGWREPRCRSGS